MYGNPNYGNPHYVNSNYGAENGWFPTMPWQEGYVRPEWATLSPGMKETFVGAGTGLIGGWLGSRQAAQAAEATGQMQQQVAMAEIAAKQQQAAAMRNMILIIAVVGIGAVVTLKVMKK